jgi:hypothetical protein
LREVGRETDLERPRRTLQNFGGASDLDFCVDESAGADTIRNSRLKSKHLRVATIDNDQRRSGELLSQLEGDQ